MKTSSRLRNVRFLSISSRVYSPVDQFESAGLEAQEEPPADPGQPVLKGKNSHAKVAGSFQLREYAQSELRQLVKRSATAEATLGESGTGKTLRLSQIIHELDARSKNPFIKVNSTAIAGKSS